MLELAKKCISVSGLKNIEVIKKNNEDKNYTIDNPQRRCPDITKAKMLGFDPKISIDEGLQRTFKYYQDQTK